MTWRTLVLSVLCVGLGLVASAGCSTESEESTVAPCEGVYKDRCSQPCTADAGCAPGLHCGPDRLCTAECADGATACGPGQTCSATGRCQAAGGGGGGGGGGGQSGGASGGSGAGGGVILPGGGSGGSGGGSNGCPDITVKLDKQIPTVLLLIDQSGSMDATFDKGKDRWNTIRDVLMDPTTGLVSQLAGEVRFGLALYTAKDKDNEIVGACPQLTEVDIKLNNYTAIDDVYSGATYEDETPTGDSIDAVVPKVLAVTEPGSKYIILATDGEPDTCEQPNPQNGQAEAIAAAQNAYAKGIGLFIVSVGSEVGEQHQQDMANAGAGLPPGQKPHCAGCAPYFPALDQSQLTAALQGIINGVRTCTFTLNGSVEAGREADGKVLLDGQSLPYKDAWRLNSPTEIEILGAACDKLKTSASDLRVSFPCGSIVVIE